MWRHSRDCTLYMTIYFSANLFLFIFVIQYQVRLRHFLGRALRLGQARGPSALPHVLHLRSMHKIYRRGRPQVVGSKNHSLGNYRISYTCLFKHFIFICGFSEKLLADLLFVKKQQRNSQKKILPFPVKKKTPLSSNF